MGSDADPQRLTRNRSVIFSPVPTPGYVPLFTRRTDMDRQDAERPLGLLGVPRRARAGMAIWGSAALPTGYVRSRNAADNRPLSITRLYPSNFAALRSDSPTKCGSRSS